MMKIQQRQFVNFEHLSDHNTEFDYKLPAIGTSERYEEFVHVAQEEWWDFATFAIVTIAK